MAVYVQDVKHQLLLKAFVSCVMVLKTKMLQKERIKVLLCRLAEVLEASMNTL